MSDEDPRSLRGRVLSTFWDVGQLPSEAQVELILSMPNPVAQARRTAGVMAGDKPDANQADTPSDESPAEVNETSATDETESAKQIPYDVPPTPTELYTLEDVKLMQFLGVIVHTGGMAVPDTLLKLWGCSRTTEWRWRSKFSTGLHPYAKEVTKTYRHMGPGDKESHDVVHKAWALTSDGAKVWNARSVEAADSGLLDGILQSTVRTGSGDDETSHPVSDTFHDEGETDRLSETPSPVERNRPSVSRIAPISVEDQMWETLCQVENIRVVAGILDPGGDYPKEWEFTELKRTTAQAGGRYYKRRWECPVSCGCRGEGWRGELWLVKGEPQHLDIIHSKRIRGVNVKKLTYEVKDEVERLLSEAVSELGVRLIMPEPISMHLETKHDLDRKVLENEVPYGCYVIVHSSRTGSTYTLDKSGWGTKGSADRGYSKLGDYVAERLAPETAERALRVAQASRSEFGDLKAGLVRQGELLSVVYENLGLLTKISGKRQMLESEKRITDK